MEMMNEWLNSESSPQTSEPNLNNNNNNSWNLAFNPSQLFMSSLDWMMNHLLSYDLVMDTLCHNIVSQLIYNRKVLQKIPPADLMKKVQEDLIETIDFREYPGNVVMNWYSWMYSCTEYAHTNLPMPPIYCLICQRQHDHPHDETRHNEFYFDLVDPLLASAWKNKGKSMYDFVRQIISFLLRAPHYKNTMTKVLERIYCPFCGKQNGQHDVAAHAVWIQVLEIENTSSKEPEPTDNLDAYTNNAFEYLMEQMPFHIPTFLVSLNNVRSFLETMVAIWKVVRLQT